MVKSIIRLHNDSVILEGRAATILAACIRGIQQEIECKEHDIDDWECALGEEIGSAVQSNAVLDHRKLRRTVTWRKKKFRG